MTGSIPIVFRRSEIVAALAVGCVALMMLGLQPALLGDLIERQRISLQGVGIVAMGEIFALGVGVVLAEKLLPLHRIRPIAVIAAMLLATVDLLTPVVHGDAACAVMRVVAGLFEACLFWITTMVIVRSSEPDRLAGIFLTLQTLAQAVAALALAQLPLRFLGSYAGFGLLALISLVPLSIATRLPQRVGTHAEADRPSMVSPRGFFALLVPFAHMSAMGTLWAYLEPLSKTAGISGGRADALVALMLIMQVGGGSLAAVVVRRWHIRPVLVASALAVAGIGLGLYALPAGHSWEFAVLCALFGLLWLFQMPFHIRLAFGVDRQGRVAMLVPAAQLLGVGFGPLIGSLGVHGDNVQRIPLVVAGFALCVLVAIPWLGHRVPSGAAPASL